MTFAIPPNRGDEILDENGQMEFRFARFLENVASIIRGLQFRPINTQESDYTLVLEDAGKIIRKTSSTAAQSYTIPPNTVVTFEIGTFINIQNDGDTSLNVIIDTDTLTSSAGLGNGGRTIATNGEATIVKVADTLWKITGDQLT